MCFFGYYRVNQQSAIILRIVILRVVMLSVILVKVVEQCHFTLLLSHYAGYHYSASSRAECYD